jgi:hypothetical protein
MPLTMPSQRPAGEPGATGLTGVRTTSACVRVNGRTAGGNRDRGLGERRRAGMTRLPGAVEPLPVPSNGSLVGLQRIVGKSSRSYWTQERSEDKMARGLRRRSTRSRKTAPSQPRACLRCDRRFLSEGPHNRLCQACREFLAVASTPVEEYLFSSLEGHAISRPDPRPRVSSPSTSTSVVRVRYRRR